MGKITTHMRQAIIADLALGLKQTDIARRFGIRRESVGRIKHGFVKELGAPDRHAQNDWRARVVTKSLNSVERALDDHTDSYKSAHIGVAALKGLGVFTEQSIVGIQVLLESMPADVREIDVTPDADE